VFKTKTETENVGGGIRPKGFVGTAIDYVAGRCLRGSTIRTPESTARLARQKESGRDPLLGSMAKERRKRWSTDPTTLLESAGGLVGAGRFERPTPCAQGSFRHIPKTPCFQLLTFQSDTGILLKSVEPC